MNRFYLIAEFILLAGGVVFGVLWARNPQGNYEPFTLLAGLAIAFLEFFRRRLPEARRTKLKTVEKPVVLKVKEETITFTELLRSLQHDIVKVHAYTHVLGIASEYEWIRRRYPGSKTLVQSLTTLDVIEGKGEYKGEQIHFDVIKIGLPDGREKEIYFDISSFFSGGVSSILDPRASIAREIAELYQSQKPKGARDKGVKRHGA